MEEDELFKQVLMAKFPNNSLAQAQIIGNDFGIIQVGNNWLLIDWYLVIPSRINSSLLIVFW